MIRAYTGRFGSGKTLSMVYDAMAYLRNGYNLITNVPFYAKVWNIYNMRDMYETKKLGYFSRNTAVVIDNLDDYYRYFATATNTVFCMDEAGIWLSNYSWDKVPDSVYSRFLQSRKTRIHFMYTVQFFEFVAKKLRTITDTVVDCSVPIRGRRKSFESEGKPLLVRNIYYDPRFYARPVYSLELEKKFIMHKSFIWGHHLKEVMNSFDTDFLISAPSQSKAKVIDKKLTSLL